MKEKDCDGEVFDEAIMIENLNKFNNPHLFERTIETLNERRTIMLKVDIKEKEILDDEHQFLEFFGFNENPQWYGSAYADALVCHMILMAKIDISKTPRGLSHFTL